MLLIVVILAVLLLGGGFGARGHATYGSYSNGGIGIGGILLIFLLFMLATGNLQI